MQQENRKDKKETNYNTKSYREIQERNERKHNIVIAGISPTNYDQDALRSVFESIFVNHLKIITRIQHVQIKKKGVYVLEFANLYHKIAVLKHTQSIRKLGMAVYPADTRMERDVMKVMRTKQVEARLKGSQVILLYRAMLVDGIKLMWSDAQEKLVQMVQVAKLSVGQKKQTEVSEPIG